MGIDSHGTNYGTVGAKGHGQNLRRSLPNRRNHITQKVKIAGWKHRAGSSGPEQTT